MGLQSSTTYSASLNARRTRCTTRGITRSSWEKWRQRGRRPEHRSSTTAAATRSSSARIVRSILTPPRMRGLEILDDPNVDPELITRSLADVARSNSLFGGLSSAIDELKEALHELPREATLLDVGTGLGDIPCRAREVAAQN